jgi:2-octaprenyl-6-methoxyphenol hydroxylase
VKVANERQQLDVVIAGGGFAGLALAIALRQALGDGFGVMVADPALASARSMDGRATAIAAAARHLFETIGAWEAAAPHAQPIRDMVITDSKLQDAVRPVFLTFAADVAEGEPFAHMIENKHLIDALTDKARAEGVVLSPNAVASSETKAGSIDIHLADGSQVTARLLVGADGARSGVRERAGITYQGWSYGQSGIVTTVAHERDHEGRAEEHFLPAGPFAILPLTGKRSSLVWTEKTEDAERLVALPDDEFHQELEQRFGLKLGDITLAGPRKTFPLGLYMARSFIAERIALIGDAAHLIHPISGQGLNMGLRDVAALAEVIADAVRLGLDPGTLNVLERYQRWRRFDTMTMGVATDSLNRLFSNHSDVLRVVRDVGLGLVERMPGLKNFFIREAAGLTGDVPKLLRGEAI